jgi:ketosteroid isomerase-like protein
MGEQENREAVERYWEALGREDFETALAELHEDFEETFVQSGERVRGKENFLAFLRANPAFPAIKVRRHLGRQDVWVTQADFDYARDGSPHWQICEVQELKDGKIARIQAYFGPPFEAAEWRAQWVEQF